MADGIMSQDVLQDVSRRADFLRNLTDPTREDTTYALNIKDGLLSCAMLRDYLAQACKIQWKEVIDDEVGDYNVTGKLFLSAVEVALKVFEVIAARSAAAEAKGIPEEARQEFAQAQERFVQAVSDVQSLRLDFQSRWPWIDLAMLATSAEEERKGTQRRSAKEVFHVLRGRVR